MPIHLKTGARYITMSQSELIQVSRINLKNTFDSETTIQIILKFVSATVESTNLRTWIFC